MQEDLVIVYPKERVRGGYRAELEDGKVCTQVPLTCREMVEGAVKALIGGLKQQFRWRFCQCIVVVDIIMNTLYSSSSIAARGRDFHEPIVTHSNSST